MATYSTQKYGLVCDKNKLKFEMELMRRFFDNYLVANKKTPIEALYLESGNISMTYEHKIEEPVPKVSVPVLELQDRSQIKPYFGTGPKVRFNLVPVPMKCLICHTGPKV